MLPDINRAIRLQILDDRAAELTKEIAALPKHIAEIEKKLEGHQRRLEHDRAATVANQKDRKRLEGEIQAADQKISKLKTQMMEAKTNEQYRAFQHEIDFCQQEIRRHEDRILDLMSESDPLEKAVKTAEASLATEKKQVEDEKAAARERTGADQKEIDILTVGAKENPERDGSENRVRIRAHPQGPRRRGDRRSPQGPVFEVQHPAAAAVPAGTEARRFRHGLRKLPADALLESASERGRSGCRRLMLAYTAVIGCGFSRFRTGLFRAVSVPRPQTLLGCGAFATASAPPPTAIVDIDE